MVDKSIEAFIMGLEIYNKPTIKYRVEGFSFFICNAWELMLKAHIINLYGEKNIYYKDSEERTITLELCIKKVFTDKHGALRKNIERIIELRNISTHFITEDYEYIYAPLFQACVVNYVEKIKEFHNKDITDYIAQNFLTLSVKINNLDTNEIKGKYSPNMLKRMLKDMEKIDSEIKENNSEFSSVFFAPWPEFEEKMVVDDEVTIWVQVMWKVRWEITIWVNEDKESVLEKAKSNESVKKWLEGKEIVKEIYVPGKILNIVVK